MKRASTGGKDESYEHVLMCLICRSLFDDYDHQPKFLPCHHTFCKDCLREYCRQIGDEIECPSCRKIANIPAAGVAALQTNFYVKYIQSLVSGGSGQNGHALECSKHAKEQLQFYCQDCETSICKECCNESSTPCLSHNKVPITKITEESHQKLDSYFCRANATIEGKKIRLEKALKALAEEKDSALLKIDSTFEQHAHTLTRRATLLKNKVIDIYNENVEKLENDLMEISTALTCIVSLKDYHEDKISHGDYREFNKGIEEIEEVDKNIDLRIHPVETHIVFEGSHGTEKYRACAKDLGRVKFNRMVSMPRTEPEGNDSADGSVQASGSVTPSPTEPIKLDSPLTPDTPTQTQGFGVGGESPVRTPDSPVLLAAECSSGKGFCDSTPSTPSPTSPAKKQVSSGLEAVSESVKHDLVKSSMTQSVNCKLTQSKVCDVKPCTRSTSDNNNLPKPNLVSEPSKGTHVAHADLQLVTNKQKTATDNAESSKSETPKQSVAPPHQTQPLQNKAPPSPTSGQEGPRVVPGANASSSASGIAVISTAVVGTGGKGRPRHLLAPTQRISPPRPVKAAPDLQVNPSTSPLQGTAAKGNPLQGSAAKGNPKKSPQEGVALASGGQELLPRPSRLPGASGLCRIPKPKGVPGKVQMEYRKGPGGPRGFGLSRKSPPGPRLSPSGQSSQSTGNTRNNGNSPKAPSQTIVPTRNANGNITMQPTPEGAINANDSERAKAEKEYYHLLYTSYDEEELLKELKSGKANLDDSDSWMTISSGDESNSTNCSDEALVESDQTTF